MSALSKIRQAGFSVALVGESFEIIPASALTQTQREFLKSHRSEIINELSAETSSLSAADRSKLLDYMAAIGETDPEMIAELLDECAKCPEKLAWALSWSNKVLAAQDSQEQALITCRSCKHFQCYNDHGGGGGTCEAGVMPFGACWWSETLHECHKHLITDKSRG